ncbi:MAG: hypothetical protein WCQ50_20440, partial [Spirochaetota bacterium]
MQKQFCCIGESATRIPPCSPSVVASGTISMHSSPLRSWKIPSVATDAGSDSPPEARCPLKLGRIWPALAIMALVLVGVVFIGAALGPASIPPEGKLFEISKGASALAISTDLELAGIVKSGFAFRILMKFDGAASH